MTGEDPDFNLRLLMLVVATLVFVFSLRTILTFLRIIQHWLG